MANRRNPNKTKSSKIDLPARAKEQLTAAHSHLLSATNILHNLHGELDNMAQPPIRALSAEFGSDEGEVTWWFSGGRWFKCVKDRFGEPQCHEVGLEEVPPDQRT